MPAPWQPPDLDEIHPDQFVINNEKVRPFLRGEGERDGKFFRLQSRRREGWIARIRMAGFNVRTLQDRIDALPSVRPGVSLGPDGSRPLTTAREQIASWDPERLRWRDLPVMMVDGQRVVQLRANEPVRRRKSRGGGDFFIAISERHGRIGLRPTSETNAIMHAYSLMASSRGSVVLRCIERAGRYTVPADQALLPAPHRETLEFLAGDGDEPWTFGTTELPLAEQVLEKLGIRLEGIGDRG